MKSVAIVAYDGCWAMSVFLAKDFFRVVELLDYHYQLPNSYEVEILTCFGEPITSSSQVNIFPDNKISDKHYDLIVLPPVEISKLAHMPPDADIIVNWLKPRLKSNTKILSLSTGSYFLAASKLLNTTVLATHWSFVRRMEKYFPECSFTAHKSYLKTGNIYTTGSFEAGINVLLSLVAEDKGDRFSQLCATHLLISEPQQLAPILPAFRNHNDNRISEVQDWIDRNFQRNIRILELSKMFNFSERNLKRRFLNAAGTAINRYVQEVRLDKAKKLLLTTELTVKDISAEVGYENDSFFTRLFKKNTGLTPAKWRYDN